MQKEIMSSLQLTVAKLELKQLEVVDKLSTKTDTEYVVRCIIDPLTTKIMDVNGDWEIVTGYNEGSCVGENWLNFIEKERGEVEHFIEMALSSVNEFVEYKTKLLTVDGMVDVRWKARYFPDIDAMISIWILIPFLRSYQIVLLSYQLFRWQKQN